METKTYTFRSKIDPDVLDRAVHNLGFKNRSDMINSVLEQAINDKNNFDDVKYDIELTTQQKKLENSNEKIKKLEEEIQHEREEQTYIRKEIEECKERIKKNKEKMKLTDEKREELESIFNRLLIINLKEEHNYNEDEPLEITRIAQKFCNRHFNTKKDFINEFKKHFEENTNERATPSGELKIVVWFDNGENSKEYDKEYIDTFKTRLENEQMFKHFNRWTDSSPSPFTFFTCYCLVLSWGFNIC